MHDDTLGERTKGFLASTKKQRRGFAAFTVFISFVSRTGALLECGERRGGNKW
jgi:hypothetical protein